MILMTKVAFFVSRNKDNQNMVGFKERKETLFCKNVHEVVDKFYKFVDEGQEGHCGHWPDYDHHCY